MLTHERGRQRDLKLRDVEVGDRVLVEDGGREEWQTVRDVSGEYVSTEENPTGYRMEAIARHERREVHA